MACLLKFAPDQRTYSTEITHTRVATSRFNAYQALQLYTKNSQKAILLLHFFTHHSKRTFTDSIDCIWLYCTKTSRFLDFSPRCPLLCVRFARQDPSFFPYRLLFFCNLLTKKLFSFEFCLAFSYFFGFWPSLFIFCSYCGGIISVQISMKLKDHKT